MSLYTPVFPGQHDNNTSIRDTKDYVDLLRNVHLFLSTQGDMLAPPSRPSSPNFEERVFQLRENVREAFLDAKGEPANGMWTQLTEQLKMQCMRGGAGSASTTDDQVAVEQDVEWILPETEQEWFEWQAKREQEKCLKKKAISMQQDYDTVPLAADQPEHTSSIATRQMAVPEQGTSNVSPSTILRAKEKVKKWQAAINPNSTSTPHFQYSQSRTSKERVSGAGVKGKALAFAKGSSSLNFPVVKRAASTAHDNKGKGPPVGHSTSNNRVAVGDSTASPIIPSAIVDSGNAELASSKASRKASPTITAKPKINDFPETLFLPPSFPSQLYTSTPPPGKELGKSIRAKPQPILPIPPSSSTPPPLTPSEPVCIREKPRPVNPSTSQAPQFGSPQVHKHPEPFPPDDPIDLPVTPTKELAVAGASAPEDASVPHTLLSGGYPVSAGPALHPLDIRKHGMAVTSPAQGLEGDGAEKNASPTKSYFSSHATSPSLSPVPTQNLLLHSPESPVFSFTQDNNNNFRPPYTSTQDGLKQPLGPMSSGVFGMGYSSQLDIEKHVDRVSELLERDVDFDSWLRDVNTLDGVETSEV
ncbi:hypothetical protein SCLCIDRAFT_1163411 [Scleroderma citrinum Foug A]|uniref:Uncharacterized protein n=1 Tax=Scleroderma citrinum Foug A TaxID=1036808 RepID=A0A0C2YRR3_9AGAM|nr:hypothetical protein SCLCIDRAFT_1163411 [Scleroderma citrinum Foug A]